MSKAAENMGFDELLKANKGLESELKSYASLNTALESKLESYEAKLNQMQFQLDQMKRLLFGAKRERFVPNQDKNQMTLPFDVEAEQEPEKQQEVITYVRSKTKGENHPGRLPLPGHLPVEEIVIEPKEDTPA